MRQIKVALPSTYIKMLYNYLVISHLGVVASQYLLYNLAGFEDIAEGFLLSRIMYMFCCLTYGRNAGKKRLSGMHVDIIDL
jgi:hypothetical protein